MPLTASAVGSTPLMYARVLCLASLPYFSSSYCFCLHPSALRLTTAIYSRPPVPNRSVMGLRKMHLGACKTRATAMCTPHEGGGGGAIHRLLPSEVGALPGIARQEDGKIVLLEGYIRKRRVLGSSLAFLDVVVTDSSAKQLGNLDDSATTPVQAVLQRDDTHNTPQLSASFDAFCKILQPGTRVSLVGHLRPSRIPSERVVAIHAAKLTCPNSNPQHLKSVLKFAKDGLLPLSHVATALCLPTVLDLELLLQLDDNQEADDAYYFALAQKVLARFPNKHLLMDPNHPTPFNSGENKKLSSWSGSYKRDIVLPPVPEPFMIPPLCIRRAFVMSERIQMGSNDAGGEPETCMQSLIRR